MNDFQPRPTTHRFHTLLWTTSVGLVAMTTVVVFGLMRSEFVDARESQWRLEDVIFQTSEHVTSPQKGITSDDSFAAQWASQAMTSPHPLDPALAWAEQAIERVRQIDDYSCVLEKREWVDGKLVGPHRISIKIRHNPFSVYIQGISPRVVAGQEAIYVEGENNGKLIAHSTGLKHRLVGAVKLDPHGTMAMRGNRYPVTEIGLLRLLERVIEVGRRDRQNDDGRVTYRDGIRIDGRLCSCLEVEHSQQRPDLAYHLARVYLDEELALPIRFEAYTWPETKGAEPPLVEEYTYTNIRLNQGFDKDDFSPDNRAYGFTRAANATVAQR